MRVSVLKIFSSLFMIIKTFYQPVREELRYLIEKTTNKRYLLSDVIFDKKGLKESPKVKKITLVDLFEKNNLNFKILAKDFPFVAYQVSKPIKE